MNFARNEIISKFYLDEFNNLKNIIQKKLGSNYESHIEDIVQTSFLKILKTNFFHDSKKGSLKSWIYIVTYNTAMEYIRKKQTRPYIQEEYDFNIPTTHSENPLIKLINQEAIDNLESKIDRLSYLERDLVKNKIDGNVQRSTARKLGISYSYAKWMLFNARRKLR